MDKKTTQMIKGIAILIMLAHHFIVIPFSELPYLITLFGYACKICVAIYAVLSGYGYFFTREKTVRYGLKKKLGITSNILAPIIHIVYTGSYDSRGMEINSFKDDYSVVWVVA